MKKKVLLLLLVSFVLTELKAIPILSLTKHNGGLFGYHYVEFHREVYGQSSDGRDLYGWVGSCEGHGFNSCNAPKSSGITLNNNHDAEEADHYDIDRAEELIANAETLINNGQNSGTLTATFQVQGQQFSRHYTLSWSLNGSGEYVFNSSVTYVLL